MADVEIDVSGSIDTPIESQEKRLANLLPIPGHIKEWMVQRRQNIRAWTVFFNTNYYKAPLNFQLLAKRFPRNLEYFLSNYIIILTILTIYCLLTSFLLMFAVCVSLGACYILSLKSAEHPIKLFGRELTKQQQYTLVGIVSMPIYYWAGVGAAVFWVFGASFFAVTLHATFFNISALQLSQDDHFDLILQEV
ncbi:hypothetical protein LSTR_LSTR011751 [Laodelphax striatellus]|uniref:PRA1 family protein n=1 Tax=Laodelphax striatellus TaxID=195883 RepID=A0A482WLV3_LAOST|nr:hypothetical protein LSTR_LSTR011751 [Laodelphax striatellus]